MDAWRTLRSLVFHRADISWRPSARDACKTFADSLIVRSLPVSGRPSWRWRGMPPPWCAKTIHCKQNRPEPRIRRERREYIASWSFCSHCDFSLSVTKATLVCVSITPLRQARQTRASSHSRARDTRAPSDPHIADHPATETRASQSDSKPIRQTALLQKVPYYTTLPGILAVTKAIAAQRDGKLEVRPLQDYFQPARPLAP